MDQAVRDYLEKNGMTTDAGCLAVYCSAFARELDRALAGRPASLMPLPSRLSPPAEIPAGETVFAVDMGGTNLRAADVCFDSCGKPVMNGIFRTSVPTGELSADAFFRILSEVLRRSDAERVGFCFSYQAEIRPDRDARILSLSKELKVRGIEGMLLGEEINHRLVSAGLRPRRFTVLNDTTAVFLSACAAAEDPRDVAASCVIGTGTNSAFYEKGQIMNAESGCYGGFPRGVFDRMLDERSAVPGDHLAEKMIGGKYLQQLTDLYCSEAPLFGMNVKEFRNEVSEALYERAAVYVTATMAALLERSGRGRDGRPAVVCFEGSTYKKNPAFKKLIAEYMKAFIQHDLGIDFRLLETEESGLTGAAIAALADTVQ